MKVAFTYIGSEEVDQAVGGSRQSEALYQEYSQHQVRECGCHIYCLEEEKKTVKLLQSKCGKYIVFEAKVRKDKLLHLPYMVE